MTLHGCFAVICNVRFVKCRKHRKPWCATSSSRNLCRTRAEYYHKSECGGAVGSAAEVRRSEDPVDDVFFAAEPCEAEQQVRVVGVVDDRYTSLGGADLQVVDDVGDEPQRSGQSPTLNASRHVDSDHQVIATTAG